MASDVTSRYVFVCACGFRVEGAGSDEMAVVFWNHLYEVDHLGIERAEQEVQDFLRGFSPGYGR